MRDSSTEQAITTSRSITHPKPTRAQRVLKTEARRRSTKVEALDSRHCASRTRRLATWLDIRDHSASRTSEAAPLAAMTYRCTPAASRCLKLDLQGAHPRRACLLLPRTSSRRWQARHHTPQPQLRHLDLDIFNWIGAMLPTMKISSLPKYASIFRTVPLLNGHGSWPTS